MGGVVCLGLRVKKMESERRGGGGKREKRVHSIVMGLMKANGCCLKPGEKKLVSGS